MARFLAIDVGTGAVKAGLFDPSQGAWQGFASRPLKMRFDGDRAEQDANEYWQAAGSVVRELKDRCRLSMGKVSTVSVTGQMRGLVLLDEDAEPIAPVMTLYDRRAREETKAFLAEFGYDGIYSTTKQRFDTTSAPAKLRWLGLRSRDSLARVRWILTAKDYVRLRLTGTAATDPVDASGWLLYDLEANRWAEDLARFALVSPAQLPSIRPSGSIAGPVVPEIAESWGIPSDAVVVVGAGDDIAATGCGAHRTGDVYEHIGSTGSVFVVTDRILDDPEHIVECYPTGMPDSYWIGGSCNSAGTGIEHGLRTLSGASEGQIDWAAVLDLLTGWADQTPQQRPLYLPYVAGERCPVWDPDVRGTWLRRSAHHTTEQMTIAVYESVALLLGWILEEVSGIGVPARVVYSAGRAGENESFGGLRATAYNLPVHRLAQPDAALFGAVLIAALATGELDNVHEGLRRWVQPCWIAHPDERYTRTYRERLAEFQRETRILISQ